jgi:hypothetical protein
VNNAIADADFFGVFVWVPVVDGSFIVERPIQTLSRGKVNGVMFCGSCCFPRLTEFQNALLAVTNAFEGKPFVRASDTTNLTQYVANLFPLFGTAQIKAVVDLYTSSGLPSSDDEAIGIMGESAYPHILHHLC